MKHWNPNLKTGKGTAWGTWEQQIIAADGSWHPYAEGTWQGKLTLLTLTMLAATSRALAP